MRVRFSLADWTPSYGYIGRVADSMQEACVRVRRPLSGILGKKFEGTHKRDLLRLEGRVPRGGVESRRARRIPQSSEESGGLRLPSPTVVRAYRANRPQGSHSPSSGCPCHSATILVSIACKPCRPSRPVRTIRFALHP